MAKKRDVFGAALNGDVEGFKAFLGEPGVFERVNKEMHSVLRAAATDPEKLKVALEAGAKPDFGGVEPPIVAAVMGYHKKQTVRLLLDAGADPNAIGFATGMTALHVACRTIGAHKFDEDAEVIDMLLAGGANPRFMNDGGETAIDVLEKMVEPFERLAAILKMDRREDLKKLIVRVSAHRGERVKPDRVAITPGAYRQEAFVSVAGGGDEKSVAGFLEAGVDINGLIPIDGVSALYWACAMNQVGVVRLLLSKGADPNCVSLPKSHDVTAIHVAVTKDVALVEPLLNAGADANKKSRIGETIWDYAWKEVKDHERGGGKNAKYDDPSMFEFLLSRGVTAGEKFLKEVGGSGAVRVKKVLGV